MKITLDNYEQYVLDFLEGNMTHHEKETFEAFLDTHPHIKDEISGVEQFVLNPHDEIVYADKSSLYRKERAIVIPFWNISRTVAAAVGFLVVTTTAFFIWKSSMNQSTVQPYDNQLTISNPVINKPNLPATRTPMQEKQPRTEEILPDSDLERPESNVIVQQENGSRELDNTRQTSPALTSGSPKKKVRSEKTVLKSFDEPVAKVAIPIHQLIEKEMESLSPELEVPSPPIANFNLESAVAFLPLRFSEIEINKTLNIPIMATLQSDRESQTYKIHIPGQFLSETWTDVSMTNFKKKLIPAFIKNQLKL